ncbi:hypothetical protein ES703_118212 [subsurface metagenome]
MYTAVCSQCKAKFRAKTRTKLLSVLRKHLWKLHRAWMIKRIKAGKAKAVGNPNIVGLLRDLATGDFIPGYKKYKRDTYLALKPALDILAKHMPPAMQVAWKLVDTLAERIYK